MNRRLFALLGLLVLTLLIRAIDPWKMNATHEVVQARPHAAAPKSVESVVSAIPTDALRDANVVKPLTWPARLPIEREFSDPFCLPAPPVPSTAIAARPVVPVQAKNVEIGPPPPPPSPQPPPLPFTAIGHWSEDNKIYAFIGDSRGTLKIKAGDLIGGNYRVDEIRPGRITMTYLPLNQQQQLIWALPR